MVRFVMVRLSVVVCLYACFILPVSVHAQSNDYEVMVHAGMVDKTIDYFKSIDFWDEQSHDQDLEVPRIIIAVTCKCWREESQKIPVETKKELFYRGMVPMVLYSNELILKERLGLVKITETLEKGQKLSESQQKRLHTIADKYGLSDVMLSEGLLNKLLERVDIIPPSLALGQTAYESGYGTSRFAIEGNALFGQWTFDGNGMQPEQQRMSMGNYGVAVYQWPFDSVRSYMLNLNTHWAYRGFREKRAMLRNQGRKLAGLDLADTLTSYSEKGTEYTETLKSIIRVNGLQNIDNAYLRDEPITLVVGVGSEKEVGQTKSELESLRASGELDRIIESMRLDGG